MRAARSIGSGYVNPSTLIAARLVDRSAHALDRSLIVHRLNVALSLRQKLHAEPYYRLVFGESDGLPGLVLERFGDVIVGQIGTAGMERLREEISEAVVKVLKPAALIWKNDGSVRKLEALPDYADIGYGAHSGPLRVREGGVAFEVDAIGGQKTGWFYDQHANRDRLAPYVRGARVLDLFSYVGAWGLRAAQFGASEVACVDASKSAIEAVRHNAALNAMQDRVSAIEADAFDFLKAARAERRHWDVVILDPPAFVKRKKDFKEGALAYRRINEMAMQVLERDGILVTCSCSHHMARAALLDAVQAGARHLDRQVQVWNSCSRPRTIRCTRRFRKPTTSRATSRACCRPRRYTFSIRRPGGLPCERIGLHASRCWAWWPCSRAVATTRCSARTRA
ncbi:MAG: class I SAM-dependent rRNA methyltransferase [Chiayiivirga sp.]|jgi:23S rRNA (cytosine1962-C5)-methyltransferase|nr:class I SAM-dependent rRNA methyltransferase [Chiayiivirga sp.]